MRKIEVGLVRYVKFLHMAARLENECGEFDLEEELNIIIDVNVKAQNFPDDLEELFKLLDGPYRATFWEMYKRKRRDNDKENNSQNAKRQTQQASSKVPET